MTVFADKYKLVLMHWPRFYSVLERYRGNHKWHLVITISYAFPLLLSVAGSQLQNNKYCTLQAVFLPATTVSFRQLFIDRNLQNRESLVPCHTSLIEGEKPDHHLLQWLHITQGFLYVKEKFQPGEVSQASF